MCVRLYVTQCRCKISLKLATDDIYILFCLAHVFDFNGDHWNNA